MNGREFVSKTALEIRDEIVKHISENGGQYEDWYVGIAADPKDRLFNDHNVSEEDDLWIYCPARSSAVARKVEKYFIDVKDTKGGPGGGDDNTRYVYAYVIGSHTLE